MVSHQQPPTVGNEKLEIPLKLEQKIWKYISTEPQTRSRK